jgi:hypothetical protein
MTETTGTLSITYPSEFQDPFFDDFEDMLTAANGIEDWLLIMWEDASLSVLGGGVFTLVGNTLAWSAPLYLVSGRTNQTLTVLASNTTILDGEIASLTGLTRPLVSAVVNTWEHGAVGPGWSRSKLPVFKRIGTEVYLVRNQLGTGERVTI